MQAVARGASVKCDTAIGREEADSSEFQPLCWEFGTRMQPCLFQPCYRPVSVSEQLTSDHGSHIPRRGVVQP